MSGSEKKDPTSITYTASDYSLHHCFRSYSEYVALAFRVAPYQAAVERAAEVLLIGSKEQP